MKKIKLRKVNISDWEDYLILKREEEKGTLKLLNKKINSPSSLALKKKFEGIISSKKEVILVAELKDKIVAYIHGMIFKNLYSKGGWVEDIFVLREYRKRGIATDLINEFIALLNKKGYKKIHLSVNVKNKKALSLYKKLGFEMYHYDLKKEWK